MCLIGGTPPTENCTIGLLSIFLALISAGERYTISPFYSVTTIIYFLYSLFIMLIWVLSEYFGSEPDVGTGINFKKVAP